MRILNVAEKADAAKKIATILSNGRFKKIPGKSIYNYIFEFSMSFQGTTVTMVVTSVSGHLMNMDLDPQYKGWFTCDPELLMDPNVRVVKEVTGDMDAVAQTLKIESAKCQKLFLWLDGDREGENIAFEVIQCCKQANRILNIENGSIKRARFSEFTPRAILSAINNLTKPDEKLSLAVEARQEIDLRIGASFTRFQTLRLQNRFIGLPDLISYGPCQFPTLGFVVQRALRIKNFQVEKFWTLKVVHQKDKKTAYFNWKRGRLYEKLPCIILFELVMENTEATVTSITKKEQRRRKPLPLNTVELQKLASQKLRMSSQKTMNVAETLYTKGLISYPRTETNFYTLTDPELKSIVREQEKDSTWGAYATRLINGEFKMPGRGNTNDNAHPPIHPTKNPGDENLTSDQKAVYELITRHFLASCSEDAIGHETVVTIDINGEQFTTRGLMKSQLNYLEIWTYEKWTDKDIPIFAEKEKFTPTEIKMDEGQTTPPPLLSESDLINLMDKNGIGTDATIATHIETIQVRGYAKKIGMQFEPTLLGLALVEAYELMGYELARPALRAKMEAEMNDISRGTRTKEAVVYDNLKMYRYILGQIAKKVSVLDQCVTRYYKPIAYAPAKILSKSFSACGTCGASMSIKEHNNHRYLLCPSCMIAHSLPVNGELTPVDKRCPICQFQVLSVLNPKTNKTHTLCPYCFSNPPDIEDSNVTVSTGMRCFQCTHPTCELAKGVRGGVATTTVNVRSPPKRPRDHNQTTLDQYKRPRLGEHTGQQNTSRSTVPQQRATGYVKQTNLQTAQRPQQQQPNNQNNAGGPELCHCGEPVKQLTSQKQNANFGRVFVRCPKMQDKGACNYFRWADEQN